MSIISVSSPGAHPSLDRPESPVVGAYRSRSAQSAPFTTRGSPRQLSCIVAKSHEQGCVGVCVWCLGSSRRAITFGRAVADRASHRMPREICRICHLVASRAPFPRGRRLTQNRRRRNARRDSGCPRCLWKASRRGEGPFCHLYAARDDAVGCVPRVTYFTASVYRPPTTPLHPLCAHKPYVGACVVCERLCDRALVKPCVEERSCLSLRSRNRWADVSVNDTRKRVFCVLRC